MTWLLLTLACSGKSTDDTGVDSADADTDTDTDTDSDTDTDTDTDTNWIDDTIELPASPLPIEIDIAGAASETATFDTIVCSYPPTGQLQVNYTLSSNAYTWQMRVLVRETFTGAGTYSTTLQSQISENFSGGRYFSASEDVVVTIDDAGGNGLYGSWTTGALTGDDGDVILNPQPIDIWCDAIDD